MTMNADDFLKAAMESGIIAADFLPTGVSDSALADDVDSIAGRLVEEGRLTSFQASEICNGKAKQLVLGPYILLDVLGKGGMGTVYRAEHRKMRRRVALKVMAEAGLKSPDAVRRFEREVEAAARLEHPNIVTAHDAGEAAGTHYLVMQLVDGKSLSEIVRERGPQPPAKVVDWILQAAQGLAYAHGRGVVHRDIKPGNMLLDREGTVKILDMGLARLESPDDDQHQLTGTGQVMGTVDFMAPEQALETRLADARSDIYSLGVTLWYLLTGRPMFAGDSVVRKIMAHQQQQPPSLREACPGIDARLDTAVKRMVAKKPEDRFQSMQEVIAALEPLPHDAGSAASAARLVGGRTGVPSAADTPTRSSVAIDLEPTTDFGSGSRDAPTTTFVSADVQPRGGVDATWRTPAVLAVAAAAAIVAIAAAILMGGRQQQAAVPATRTTATTATVAPQPSSLDASSSKPAPNAPPPAVAPFDAGQAKAHQEAWAKHLGVQVETTNSIGQTLVVIPTGRFLMGGEQTGIVDVTLTKPFLLGQTEVTQGQWRAIMGTTPWTEGLEPEEKSRVHEGNDVAATVISWDEAVEFCSRLTERERASLRIGADQQYRLPTDAEWEYACRAGTVTRYWFGDDDRLLGDHGWFGGGWDAQNRRFIPGGNTADAQHPHAVRLKPANPWRLHDVHGNVSEWCQDRFAKLAVGEATDPTGPDTGDERVTRGGAWANDPGLCRSSSRFVGFRESFKSGGLGFRVALGPVPASQPADDGGQASGLPAPAVAPFDATEARAHQKAWATHLGISVETTDSIGQKLVVIPPGRFLMGDGRESFEAVVTRPYLIGRTEVTQGQWWTIMGTTPWTGKPLSDGRTYAVDDDVVAAAGMTWLDAATFCARLSSRERASGGLTADQEYRLPTEAEWEHACRAGTFTTFSFGDDAASLGDHGWYGGGWDNDKSLPIAGGNTADAMHVHPVGTKTANAWGLFDVHGNVNEWNLDCLAPWPDKTTADPIGTLDGPERAVRGGGWYSRPERTRSAHRQTFPDSSASLAVGFRVVVSQTATHGKSSAAASQPGNAPLAPTPPPAVAPFDAGRAKVHQEAWAKQLGIPVETTNSIGQALVVVPPGQFTMTDGKESSAVTLTKPFLLGQTEVTQGQWRQVMETAPWSGEPYAIDGDDVAASYVLWEDAATFCRRLTDRERAAGRITSAQEYRLPSEAEWEFACRAGTQTKFSFGDDADGFGDCGWFGGGWDWTARVPRPGGNIGELMRTHAVRLKKANPWGLHDMHGNVWEWCNDWCGDYPQTPVIDPHGPATGPVRIYRGGGWDFERVGSGHRNKMRPAVRYSLGFRVALDPPEAAAAASSSPPAANTSR